MHVLHERPPESTECQNFTNVPFCPFSSPKPVQRPHQPVFEADIEPAGISLQHLLAVGNDSRDFGDVGS